MTYNRPICNCPDAANNAAKNLFSNYFSQTFDRNWKTRTNAEGQITTFRGIRERGFYCKHEMSVIRQREEIAQAFPNGIPYEEPIRPLIEKPVTYNMGFNSDQLSSDNLFIKSVEDYLDV